LPGPGRLGPERGHRRLLRKEYDNHVRQYLWQGRFWSSSYFAGSCGGAPLTVVKQDIENQKYPTG
ncbi:transposase, partial [Streptomyces aureus]|uniref:transposase n=1 Tax=Streptomyces aureus TaxID=193461 RepID=UPI0033D633C5